MASRANVDYRVIRNDGMLTMSDYQKFKIFEQNQKLYDMSQVSTDKAIEEKKEERFYNLSLKHIIENIVTYIINLINSITRFVHTGDTNQLMNATISNGDGLIYLGIILVLVSLIFYFIDTTS